MRRGPEDEALEEAREAIQAILGGQTEEVELAPQPALVRRLQHELAERASLSSSSSGHEPYRRVQIYR
jgi:predicted RNA-binding protein Jag